MLVLVHQLPVGNTAFRNGIALTFITLNSFTIDELNELLLQLVWYVDRPGKASFVTIQLHNPAAFPIKDIYPVPKVTPPVEQHPFLGIWLE